MSNTSNGFANRKSAWYLRFSTWVALFGLMLAAIVSVFTWREMAAARELNEELSRDRQAGLPVDKESLAAWYHSQTSTEGTLEWSEIVTLASSQLISSRMQLFNTVESPDPPFPEDSPEYFEHLKDFIGEVQPLLDRIRAAGTLQKPVWIPIPFDAYWDRFSTSRYVLQLVSLECKAAVHDRDATRALQSLETMQNCVAAFDWNLGWVSTNISMSHRHTLYDSLQRSLEVDLWDEDHLALLKETVRPLDLNQAWQKMLDVSRVDLAESSRGMVDFMPLPSVKKRMADQLQRSRSFAKEGYRGLSERSKRQLPYFGNHWWSDQQFQYGEIGKVFLLLENQRRFTMAAIELKRFSLENKRLPTDLRELDQFSRGGVELENCDGIRFDYDIDSDRKAATLWGRINEATERASPLSEVKKTPGLRYSVTVGL